MIKIGLDAGHYTGDDRVPGAFAGRLGTKDEYALNLRVFRAVSSELKAGGYEVEDIGKQDKNVVSRAKRAGESGCDAVISLHHNAGGGRGITLYRHTNGVMGKNSRALQNALYRYLQEVNRGDRTNPVTEAELGVINSSNTKCPSVLIECGFMDHPEDVEQITSSGYAEKIALAVLAGCNAYFGREEIGEGDMALAKIWEQRTVLKVFTPFAVRAVAAVPDGDTLTVRIGPDPSAPVLATWPALDNGNRVDVMVKYDNNWAAVVIAGKYTGYVNAAYLMEEQQ